MKKIIAIVSGFAIAVLVTSNFASAANLNQAANTLPPNDEWAVMARAAVGQSASTSFLRSPLSGGSATDYEKRILAITAIGENPKTFGSEDFVTKLESMFSGNQIGDVSLLNDDIFGILALKSAGISDNVVSSARQYILAHQNSDGGFGFATSVGSDSNSTAMAIAALSLTGSVPNSAFDYISRTEDASGGYSFMPSTSADGASTAWVIAGLNTAGRSVPASATTFLNNLQTADGSFKWKPTDSSGSGLVTAYAVIALSGHGIPIRTFTAPIPLPPVAPPPPVVQPTPLQVIPATHTVHVTITYPGNRIYAGNLNFSNQTALEALTTAANQINLLYVIKQTSFGPFVSSVDGYAGAGLNGWQYAINGSSPQVGASDYHLHDLDNLQWFYAPAGGNPF